MSLLVLLQQLQQLLLACAAAGGSVAAASSSSQQCLPLINSAGDLDLKSAQVGGACAGHSALDRSYVCGGIPNQVQARAPRAWMGTGDFTISVTMMLETVNATAAALVLAPPGNSAESYIGLDGSVDNQSGMFAEGPHWTTTLQPTPAAPKAGEWFNLTCERVSGVLTVSVGAIKVFTLPAGFPVATVDLRPWRSNIHARSFTICAPLLPAPGAPPPPPPTVTVFAPGEAGIPIYRIPALCAAGGTLVAFAEGRETHGGDFAIKRNMFKRSQDAGRSWSTAEVVPGTWQEGWCVGQPTCAYDPVRKLLVLQYQNSTTHRQVNGVTMQVTSNDSGASWNAPQALDQFMGQFRGTFPGPGNGLVLSSKSKKPGRWVFPSWGVAGPYIYDIVSFSDDGGRTYSVSKTHFPANLSGVFAEPTVAETQGGDVLINMRMANDAAACGGSHCRFGALSTDGGASFSAAAPVPKLVSPGCQGSVMLHPPSGKILYSGPYSGHARQNGTLQYSEDGAADSWKVQSVTDAGVFAYSCLALLPNADGGTNSTHVAVIYEGHSGLLFLAKPAVTAMDAGDQRQPPLPASAASPAAASRVIVATPSPAPFLDAHVQCSASWDEAHWPNFHILNNVTRRSNGALVMEDLNDANALFHYRGLWHVMFQSGDGPPPYGWRWAHKVSSDLVHWYPIADALTPNMSTNTSWDEKGACVRHDLSLCCITPRHAASQTQNYLPAAPCHVINKQPC